MAKETMPQGQGSGMPMMGGNMSQMMGMPMMRAMMARHGMLGPMGMRFDHFEGR